MSASQCAAYVMLQLWMNGREQIPVICIDLGAAVQAQCDCPCFHYYYYGAHRLMGGGGAKRLASSPRLIRERLLYVP